MGPVNSGAFFVYKISLSPYYRADSKLLWTRSQRRRLESSFTFESETTEEGSSSRSTESTRFVVKGGQPL